MLNVSSEHSFKSPGARRKNQSLNEVLTSISVTASSNEE